MASKRIRISEDIEAIAQEVADQKGLVDTRTAVEAIVRCHYQDYLNGSNSPSSASEPTQDKDSNQ